MNSGTIDKAYPRTIGGYAFEICGPAVEKILTRIKPSVKCRVITICQKDSQDITDSDRKNLIEACQEAQETKILVTHGTDTMIQTAEYLARHLSNKVVVLTGAFLPETFKESDADFNIGTGIGALQTLQRNGCPEPDYKMGQIPSQIAGVRLKSLLHPGVTKESPPLHYRPSSPDRNKASGELITTFNALPTMPESGDEYWMVSGQFLPCNDSLYVMTSTMYYPRPNAAWSPVKNLASRKIFKVDLNKEQPEYIQICTRGGMTFPVTYATPDGMKLATLAPDSIHVTSMVKYNNYGTQTLQRAQSINFGRYRNFAVSYNGDFFAILGRSTNRQYILYIYSSSVFTRPLSTTNVTKLYKGCNVPNGHQHDFTCLRWSTDTAYVGVGFGCGHLVVFDWRRETGVCSVFEDILPDCALSSVKAYDFDRTSFKRVLSAGTSDGRIYKVDCEDYKVIGKIELGGEATVDILAYRYDDCRLIVALSNFVIQVYDGESLSLLCDIRMKESMDNLNKPPLSPYCPSIVTMDVSMDGQVAVVGTWTGVMSVWQLPKILNLKYLCKYKILCETKQGDVQKLPLPNLMKDYLLSFPYTS
ncbi:hypothetical protein FSP39_025028 [Pinctada imbricata]|uniref:SOCS box domain-containing protein n=1 Tax=Pinctada imbricata TaxID=66713 RepID=A0AA88Y4Q4_PINIB|nr:hypothetical protein FSP39_025028 [Pinctada imbricata]